MENLRKECPAQVGEQTYHDVTHDHEDEDSTQNHGSIPGSLGEPYSIDDVFEPLNLESSPMIDSGLPPELWSIVQSARASFTPQYFLDVSRNLLENPNLTASHLSRAELSYQSFKDPSFNPEAQQPHDLATIVKHLKTEHQPRLVSGGYPGYTLEWTVVRKLIPRNPKLDDALIQTCHLFTSTTPVMVRTLQGRTHETEAERYLVVYLPHVSNPDQIPFYHPKVQALAILYMFQPNAPPGEPPGILSIYYNLFPERPLDNRMSRTALKMLQIIHKHSRGRMAGYQKRVHHDVVIPQKTFQDTYAYLKGKYAKDLIDNWVEQTPAQKHVFEDLGIAAFLIELWTDMYGEPKVEKDASQPVALESMRLSDSDMETESESARRANAQRSFPGFVDIGCGNGLLVWILNKEGWNGWGFDARRRKTWNTFGEDFNDRLKVMLLVPEVLKSENNNDLAEADTGTPTHNGVFSTGTFLVANHADELTVWTPCLAFLSESPFMAIPCCSHNFGGTRFRAPHKPPKDQAQNQASGSNAAKLPSAYASFCSYITHLTSSTGFAPEKEYLRIPSTRNVAIIGRKKAEGAKSIESHEDKLDFLKTVVEREMPDTSIDQVRLQWLKRGSGLVKPGKGAGH